MEAKWVTVCKRIWQSNIRTLALFVLILVAVIWLSGVFSDYNASEYQAMTEQNIIKASIQCYAIEGMYPPNVAYLEQHYGVQVDHDGYIVHYMYNGANLPPDITVFIK